MFRKRLIRAVSSLSLLAFVVASTVNAEHWVYLENAHFDQQKAHKTIHVGTADGSFHKIQLRVNGGAVFFERVVVHFADGTQEELAMNDRVRSGGKTRKLDLPGGNRVLDSVELWYSKEKPGQNPEVSLYGAR